MSITKRYAQVASPGVIVSTIVEDGHAETVTFSRADDHPGFTTKVERGDARDAEAMQALAVAVAR